MVTITIIDIQLWESGIRNMQQPLTRFLYEHSPRIGIRPIRLLISQNWLHSVSLRASRENRPAYDAVFQALVDMRKNLDEKINLFNEQIRHAQRIALRTLSHNKRTLWSNVSMASIISWSRCRCILRSTAIFVGASETSMKKIPSWAGPHWWCRRLLHSLAEILAGRVDYLKAQGKIRDR